MATPPSQSTKASQSITLSQGSGGAASNALIENIFLRYLREHFVTLGEDAGVFSAHGQLAVSTDSFVITPLIFPGGDIGKLSVCGSSNDVAMMGAARIHCPKHSKRACPNWNKTPKRRHQSRPQRQRG